jgi:hypothetical protein
LFFKRKDEPAYSYADRKSTTAETDMTIFFRKLSEIKKQQTIEDAFELIKESFYKIEEVVDKTEDA